MEEKSSPKYPKPFLTMSITVPLRKSNNIVHVILRHFAQELVSFAGERVIRLAHGGQKNNQAHRAARDNAPLLFVLSAPNSKGTHAGDKQGREDDSGAQSKTAVRAAVPARRAGALYTAALLIFRFLPGEPQKDTAARFVRRS